jgi:hypothetical protein
VAGRRKFSDLIGTGTHNLLAWSIAPQPTMLPHVPTCACVFFFPRVAAGICGLSRMRELGSVKEHIL